MRSLPISLTDHTDGLAQLIYDLSVRQGIHAHIMADYATDTIMLYREGYPPEVLVTRRDIENNYHWQESFYERLERLFSIHREPIGTASAYYKAITGDA